MQADLPHLLEFLLLKHSFLGRCHRHSIIYWI